MNKSSTAHKKSPKTKKKKAEKKPNPAQQSSFFAYNYSNSQNETIHVNQDNLFTNSFVHSPVHIFNEHSKTLAKPMTWCYSMTPIHLKSLDIICKIFGRSRYTIKQWVHDGTPIVYDGVSYISEYNALFSWLLNYYRENKFQ